MFPLSTEGNCLHCSNNGTIRHSPAASLQQNSPLQSLSCSGPAIGGAGNLPRGIPLDHDLMPKALHHLSHLQFEDHGWQSQSVTTCPSVNSYHSNPIFSRGDFPQPYSSVVGGPEEQRKGGGKQAMRHIPGALGGTPSHITLSRCPSFTGALENAGLDQIIKKTGRACLGGNMRTGVQIPRTHIGAG